MNEVLDLVNELSSGEMSKDEYVNVHKEMLEDLDTFEEIVDRIEVNNIEDYRKAMNAKGKLTSLFCYAFNNRDGNYEEVAELNDKLGDKIYRFAKNHKRIEDSELRSVAKYLITCWDKYFRYEDKEKMVKELAEAGKLRKDTHEGYDGNMVTNYFVIGLHYAVGDNTFSIDNNGNENRRYKQSCAVQAFYVKSRFHDTIEELEEDGLEIPFLDDYFSKTSVRKDAKESARVYLSRKDKRIIRGEYTD